MAETIREMLIRLTMDAGGMQKATQEAKRQIAQVTSEIKSMGDDADAKLKLLGEKLDLQKGQADNYAKAIEQAKTNLANAATEADKLAKAKNLSTLETELVKVQNAAKATADEINRINAAKFTNFGTAMQTAGRHMQNFARGFNLYVAAPLAALGVSSYKAFTGYESAFAGVKKTVEETDTTKYEDLNAAFLEMSEQIPVAYEEFSALGESAGALGVGADQLVKFVRTVADLSATTDDLDAQTGANVLARLLNITEQGDYSNIDRVGAALVDLGNKTAATEGEIAAMAQRMASTGELADFSTPEILALAAGFTSVGINAEAGGSAAGKLMKKMQLAAEVGGKAMRVFADEETTAGMSLREIQLAADDTKWLTGLADALQMTKKETKNLIDSGAALEQFSGVMGLTAQQYIAGWNQSSAQSMMAFFQGLASLEATQGEESILSMLAAMDLTEIRLSNLIAAAASNPQLFADALSTANQAYEENIALADEANKRYATTASQDTVRYNKIENAQADLGENVATAIEPAKKAIDGLLESFNALSDVDQQKIVNVMGSLIIGGAGLQALASTTTAIGNITKGIGYLVEHKTGIISALSGIAQSPIFQVVAAGAAVYALASFLNSIPTNVENILAGLADIKININQESKDATLAAIAEVKAAKDALTGEKSAEYEGYSAAVAAGYGTAETFGMALEYERMKAEKGIADISAMYGPMIKDLDKQIAAAVTAGDETLAGSLRDQREAQKGEWDQYVKRGQTAYTEAVTALVNGMMLAQPEAKAALERASKEYDLLALLEQVMDSDADEADWEGMKQNLLKGLAEAGYGEEYDLSSSNFSGLLTVIREDLMKSLTEDTALANKGSLAYTLLDTLLSAKGVTDLLDFTQLHGALDGIVETMDFKQAAQKAKDDGKLDQFGQFLTGGLADGVTNNAGAVAATMTTIRNDVLAALRAAFEMHSPSMLMTREGINIPAGIADGIRAGAAMAVNALNAMGSMLQTAASAQGSAAAAAYVSAFNAGMSGLNKGGAPGTGGSVSAKDLRSEMQSLTRREQAGYGSRG